MEREGFFITTVISGVLALMMLVSCEDEIKREPPLRPLVYKEKRSDLEAVQLPSENSVIADLSTPQALGLEIYRGFVGQDPLIFESLFPTPREAVIAMKMRKSRSETFSVGLIEKSNSVYKMFGTDLPSEVPAGGLITVLELVDFEIGKGRTIDNRIARRKRDQVVMHLGNVMMFRLSGTDKIFKMRVPKIVKTQNGWKIAEAPVLERAFNVYIEAGFHLKASLISSKEYQYPLSVGNFWHYRVREAGGSFKPGEFFSTFPDEFRVEVKEVETFNASYNVVTMLKTYNDPRKKAKWFGYLVTPRRIYNCNKDCRRRSSNFAWVLDFAAMNTPIFVFPMERGKEWGKSKTKGMSKYHVKQESVVVEVPAGNFVEPLVIAGSAKDGNEERSFVPGVGLVMRRVQTALSTKYEELTLYRIIN